MKKLVLILLSIISSFIGFSQNGYDWGENKQDSQGNWVYMTNLINEKRFQEAKTPTVWLLKNTPNLHLDLYVQAIKVYEALEKEEKVEAKKIGLQDTILALYDIRISKFNDDKANVLNRKGLVAFKFLYSRAGKGKELFTLYDEIITLNGVNSYSTNIMNYVNSACIAKSEKVLTDEQVLDVYDKSNDALDAQLKAEPTKEATVNQVKEVLDNTISKCVSLSCDFAMTNLGPKLNADPTNLKLAKRVMTVLRSNACVSNTLYLDASDVVLAAEPTFLGFKERGNVLHKLEKDNEAIETYLKAIEMTNDQAQKSDLFLTIAKIQSSKGQKSSARANARKAIETGANVSEAHVFIGDLYLYSYKDCTSDDVLQSRSVFIAAYDEYKRAGNNTKMAEAQKNFPSMEEIFVRNKKVGETISTGCWINETVVLQKRP